jgi:hypothetical protein
MDQALYPMSVESETFPQEQMDSVTEYQQWYMRMKMLVRESQSAKENGEWKKAQDLLHEVSVMTREYCDRRIAHK